MSADQLEDRGARWGCISFEQIAVSREARGLPVATMYSSPSPETIRHRDLFVSYEQGTYQILQHYLKIKWGLFEQGWPDPIRRSTAFCIEDTISGLYNPAVRNGLNRARPPSMSSLQIRAARLVEAERTHMIRGRSTYKSTPPRRCSAAHWSRPGAHQSQPNFPSRRKSLVPGHATLQAGSNPDGRGLDLALGGILQGGTRPVPDQRLQSDDRTDHTHRPRRTAAPVVNRNPGGISRRTERRVAGGSRAGETAARETAAGGTAARETTAGGTDARGAVARGAVARGEKNTENPTPDKYPLFPHRASFYTHS